MLPNIPLLNNNIRHSGIIRSASYNTRNYITKIPSVPLNLEKEFDQLLKHTVLYNSTRIHELCHWTQNQCSTFGTFIHALKFSQEMTLLTHLRDLPDEMKDEIIQKRKNNRPIFVQDQNTKQPKHQKYTKYNYEINILCQFWFDFQWIITTLEDSRIVSSIGMPTGEIFGFVIGDIYIYYNEILGNNNLPTFSEARSWYNFKEGNTKRLVSGNDELTSNSIMECAATISELQFLMCSSATVLNNSGISPMLNQRFSTLLNSTYGIPFRIFLDIYGSYPTQITELLSTVNILCFIALNPPLPPYYIKPPTNNVCWDWHEIYPPSRFINASNSVKKIGLLKANPNQNEIKEYILKISNVSNLITIVDSQNLCLKQAIDINFEDKTTIYNDNNFLHHDYLFWVQNKFSKSRDKFLPFLANTGTCFTGDLSIDSAEIVLSKFDEFDFAISPLVWTDNNKIGFHSNSNFGNAFLNQVAVSYTFFDFVSGTGAYDLTEFPPEISNNDKFRELVNNNIINSIYTKNQT